MDPATIIGTTSAVLSFVQFAGKIIKTGAELHSKKTNATEINKSFEESVTDFEERVVILKTKTSHATISHSINSPKTDDVWDDLLRCSSACEKLGRRILELLAKCKAKTKPPRVGIRERLNITLSATHKVDVLLRAEYSLTEVMRASVVTVWTSDEIESLRGQWSQCIAAFNAACARLESSQRFDCLVEIFQHHSSHLGTIQSLVRELVDKSQNPNLTLLKLCNDYREANSTAAQEVRNREWILNALVFPGMQSRWDQIQSDIGKTFRWIASCKPLIQWLYSTDGIYHISGKPGSGKSTMMKFIDGNPNIHEQLDKWAKIENRSLLKASFYAWKPTSDSFKWKPEDASCMELLIRSLLHQLLMSTPEYIQIVFLKYWSPERYTVFNTLTQTNISKPKFSFSELKLALHQLLDTYLTQSYRIFFLIDAMDEFGHPYMHEHLAQTIQSWCHRSPLNLKICVSSREDNPFLNTFPARHRLQLHLHTTNDIKELVTARLTRDSHFRSDNFRKEDREKLIGKIVHDAQGVFVWVVFTINELLRLLTDGQDFEALETEVDTFCAKDMNDFFAEIFNRIPHQYHREARAVFSIMVSISAHPIRGYFLLPQYAAISKCLNPSATASQSKSHRWVGAEHDSHQFKSRLPSMSRGMLELHDFTDCLEGPDCSDGESDSRLSFNHRCVYDFFKDNPSVLANVGREGLPIDSLSLILRSFVRVAEMTIPSEIRKDHRRLEALIHRLLSFVGAEGRDSTGGINPLYLKSLRDLDIAVLHSFKALPLDTAFESSVESDLTLGPLSVSVFYVAICFGFPWYGTWALDDNYPSWIRNDLMKDHVSGLILGFQLKTVSSRRLQNVLRSGYLLLNEPSRCLKLHTESSLRVKGSLWLYLCIQLIAMTTRISGHELSQIISEFHAEPRIGFQWWSEGSSHQQEAPRHKETQPWAKWSADDRLVDTDLGDRFGLKVTVGDDPEGQLIQGPQWSSNKHDTRIIRLFIYNFGTASGKASLRDVFERLLTPNDGVLRAYSEESQFATSREKRLIEPMEKTLRAMDEALARAESAAESHASNKQLEDEGGDEDRTVEGLQTKDDRCWESGAVRSRQQAPSVETGGIWTQFTYLVPFGLGKFISFTVRRETKFSVLLTVYLYLGIVLGVILHIIWRCMDLNYRQCLDHVGVYFGEGGPVAV